MQLTNHLRTSELPFDSLVSNLVSTFDLQLLDHRNGVSFYGVDKIVCSVAKTPHGMTLMIDEHYDIKNAPSEFTLVQGVEAFAAFQKDKYLMEIALPIGNYVLIEVSSQ